MSQQINVVTQEPTEIRTGDLPRGTCNMLFKKLCVGVCVCCVNVCGVCEGRGPAEVGAIGFP